MSTEDNNTRVLYEKAISSIPPDKTRWVCVFLVGVVWYKFSSLALACSEVWEKFVDFESSVGDLASLIKVEKRRAATIKTEVCTP